MTDKFSIARITGPETWERLPDAPVFDTIKEARIWCEKNAKLAPNMIVVAITETSRVGRRPRNKKD